MRAVGYVRVSTEGQVRDGVLLEAQQAKLEAHCLVEDWDLLPILHDEGYTAKHLKRPGLETLFAPVDADQVEVVIVYKLNRLTRSVADPGHERDISPADAPGGDPQGRKEVLFPRLLAMEAEGLSHRAMADRLNTERVPTISDRGQWQLGTVGKLLAEA